MLEKSCGTVLFMVKNATVYYLLTQAKDDGYCGFPKGHMEENETEEETAFRETWEETSIIPHIISDFRVQIQYKLNNGNTKTVVYFLADYSNQVPKRNKNFEDLNYLILPFDEAYNMLTFENTKKILKDADKYIKLYFIDR